MNGEAKALRSFLFAPGNHARRVEKALSLDADAVILDLEDAVATAEKPATREAVAASFARQRRGLLYVRVNAVDTEFCYGDLVAVVRPGLDGIILPKVESAAGLATIDWLLAQLERERGLAVGGIDLIPIIETARVSTGSARSSAPARGSGASRSAPAISRSTSTWSGAAAKRSWPMPAPRSSPPRAPPGSRRRSTRSGSIWPTPRGSKPRRAPRSASASRARCASTRTRSPIVNRVFTPSDDGDRLRRAGRGRFRQGGSRGQRRDPARRQVHRLPDRLPGAAGIDADRRDPRPHAAGMTCCRARRCRGAMNVAANFAKFI